MKIKTCSSCGRSFSVKDEDEWKKTCLPCWKAEKNGEKSAWRNYSQAIDRENMYRQMYEEEKRKRVDPEMVKRLLQLCHPDKHGNSEASQKATKWLLEMKR